MKVVRMTHRHGWRIKLTDSEMEALRLVVERGAYTIVGAGRGLNDKLLLDRQKPLVRKALRSRAFTAVDGVLPTDEDRRDQRVKARRPAA